MGESYYSKVGRLKLLILFHRTLPQVFYFETEFLLNISRRFEVLIENTLKNSCSENHFNLSHLCDELVLHAS